MSRLDRIVAEHNQFSLGVKELQDWMSDAVHMLESYCLPTAHKSVLDGRMLKLEVCITLAYTFIDVSHVSSIAWYDCVVLCLYKIARCSVDRCLLT